MKHRDDQPQADFYTDMTLPNYGIPAPGENAGAPNYQRGHERLWTRRTFFALGGIVLGAGGLGVGYAASRSWLLRNIGDFTKPPAMATHIPAQNAKTPAPRPSATPTRPEMLLSFTQHQQNVLAVSWASSQYLASGANDGSLLIWNAQGEVQASSPQGVPVRAIAASPDGLNFAAGADNQLLFLASPGGATLASLQLDQDAIVSSLAWSPQNPARVVSGALNDRALVWDAVNYRVETIFTRHTTPVEAVSWAADGQTIGSSSAGGAVRIWDSGSDEELHGMFLDAQLPRRAIAFAPSGSLLAVGGDDGAIRLWNGLVCQQQSLGMFGLQCMDMPRRLQGHMAAVRALGWSADARLLASGGDDGQLIIWQPAQSAAPLLKIPHPAPIIALAWSPTSREIATAAGNVVTLWRLR